MEKERGSLLDPDLIERRQKVGDFLGSAVAGGADYPTVRAHFDNLRNAEVYLASTAAFGDQSVEHPHDPAELLPFFKEELTAAEDAQRQIVNRTYQRQLDASS